MSKSYGNYIGLTDEPADMFGKVMSIPDSLIVKYYRLTSDLPVAEIDAIEAGPRGGRASSEQSEARIGGQHRDLVPWRGCRRGSRRTAFDRVFKEHAAPTDIDEVEIDLSADETYVPGMLVELGMASSSGEGRRLIDGGRCQIRRRSLGAEILQRSILNSGRRRSSGRETQIR